MATSPFVEKPCTVVINNNYDTRGTLTRSSIDSLTPAQLKALFTRDDGTTWVETGPWFKTAFEMAACGIKRNGLYDWVMSSAKNVGKLVNVTKVDRSPSLVQPFVLARQLSVINRDYWAVVGGNTAANVAAGLNTAGTAIGTLTTTPLVGLNGGTHILRVVTRYGFDLDANWFVDKDRVTLMTRAAGAAQTGQWKVMASATNTARTYIDIAVVSENPAGTSPSQTPATTTTGVLLAGVNNVNDYEAWCNNRPSLNPEKRVPFWYQTMRRVRRVDQLYKETFARLMADNQYFQEFIDLPLAEKNRQDEEEYQRRLMWAFFFQKPISSNQTLSLYQSLEQIVTASGATINPGSNLTGKFIQYRANFVGVYEQLRACDRVRDIGNSTLNLKELFDEIYNVVRSRKSQGRPATSIDIYTDTQTASAFASAMMNYYKNEYQDMLRITQSLSEGRNEALGFFWASYKLKYPQGVTINVITHDFFDDIRNAFNTESLDTRGRFFLILDLGKGGSIYPGLIASNRKVHTLGQLENMAKMDTTYACVMESLTEEVTLTSQTMTAVVECPSNSLWIENFSGFQVPDPFANQPDSDYDDLIGTAIEDDGLIFS